jgi:hypothetical protein
VTIEQILTRVDIEGGMGFLMQGTESDELRASTDTVSGPVVSLQEIQ